MATIIHLSTIHPRGDARILVREARTLAARMPEHRVILMIADGAGDHEAPQGEVSVRDLGALGGKLQRAVVGPWRAFCAIRHLRAVVVHFHDPELIFLGIVLRMFGHAVIYDVHEDVPKQVLTKHWIPALIRRPLAAVVAGCEAVAARLLSGVVVATDGIAVRFPGHKVVIIQNFPVADELRQPGAGAYRTREASFVYPGVLAEVRGTLEIVTAMEHLTDHPEARLDLAGPCSPAAFWTQVQQLPGWPLVRYHGEIPRQRVSELLNAARAGLVLHRPIPNEVEARPVKTFEYMSVGLPVIASDFPAWRQLLEPIGCALLVNPLDPPAVAAAMRWVLEHPDQAEAMGRRGREAVVTTFNWSVEADRLVTFYRRFLPERGQ